MNERGITVMPDSSRRYHIDEEIFDNIPRPVKIEYALNGWSLHIGCQQLVFTSLDEMLREVKKYLSDPAQFEEEYSKKRSPKVDEK